MPHSDVASIVSEPHSAGLAGVKKRRPRPKRTCLSCGERRVKCDRLHPSCSECLKRGLACVYAPTDKPPIHFMPSNGVAHSGNSEPSEPSEGTFSPHSDESVVDHVPQTHDIAGDTLWLLASTDDETRAHYDQIKHLASPCSLQVGPTESYQLINEIVRTLPPRDACTSLFHTFLSNVHPILPVCNPADLSRHFATFTSDYPSLVPLDSIALILAALHSASLSLLENEDSAVSVVLLNAYEKVISSIGFPNNFSASTIPLVQGHLLTNVARTTQLQPIRSFEFLPQLVRAAQLLRLHVGSCEDRKLDPAKEYIRGQIWWHLVYLDIEASVGGGMPRIIHADNFSTPMPPIYPPSSLSFISPWTNHKPGSAALAVRGRFLWAQRLHNWLQKMPTNEDRATFARDIDELAQEAASNTPEDEWVRMYLRVLVERGGVCVLARQSLNRDTLRAMSCDHEVLRYSRSFLSAYVQACTPCTSSPQSPSHHFLAQNLIPPFPGLMALLLHLSTCRHLHHESSALSSRTLIDAAFAVLETLVARRQIHPETTGLARLQASTHFSPNDAPGMQYNLMSGLRQRVWANAGWSASDTAEVGGLNGGSVGGGADAGAADGLGKWPADLDGPVMDLDWEVWDTLVEPFLGAFYESAV